MEKEWIGGDERWEGLGGTVILILMYEGRQKRNKNKTLGKCGEAEHPRVGSSAFSF